jgi:hypothetical protein
MSYSEPGYTTLCRASGIEYRQYDPHLVAETLVQGADFHRAGNEGFRRLFRYIAGGNRVRARIAMTSPVSQAGEKIAMTVPVEQANSGDGWRVAFMLPAGYTRETAPVPTDERVRIVPVPGRLVAVLRYAGRWTEGNYLARRGELQAVLATAGINPLSEPLLARYNGPFSLPFLRRNEIQVAVDRLPATATSVPAVLTPAG